ncbi:MAG: response regulator [Pseudomonadales bacterium]|nr:response regulator [Pseudomonadales bacterium]
MSNLMQNALLDELHHDARTGDVLKARLLMESLGDFPPAFQQQVFDELDLLAPAFQADVFGYLLCGDDLQNALTRAEISAALLRVVLAEPLLLLSLLEDTSLVHRERLLDLFEGVPQSGLEVRLLKLIDGSDVAQELALYIRALGHLGVTSAVGALEEFLYSPDRRLVESAVLALGNIESIPAIDALGRRLGGDAQTDVLIMSRLARLATSHAIGYLVAQLGAASAYIRTRAKEHLIELGTHAIPLLIEALDTMGGDALIHALNVLAATRDELAVAPIRHLLHDEPPNPNVRFAAYEALGMLPMRRGGYVLAGGLADPDAGVRLAAAVAIERNLDDRLLAGLANMTRMDSGEAREVVIALVEGRAVQSVLGLIGKPVFVDMLVDILNGDTHPDTAQYFAQRLAASGAREVAERLVVHRQVASRKVIYAVDDSRMILSIYKSGLFALGYDVEVFEFPVQALDRMREALPLALFTDLNMPELDGIALTRAIRREFPDARLPIVMVTTQSEGGDAADAYDAGVDAILGKPFSKDDLARELDRLL